MGSVYHDENGELRTIIKRVWEDPMKHILELELDIITDISPVELASRIAPLVQEAVEAVKQSLGTELAFDIFLVLDGREVRFVMKSV